jgi:putative ABC transport system ATP-binding protein
VADRHAEPEDGVKMSVSLSTGRQAEAVLEANDLYRFYHAGEDETFALRGVSLTVAPGEILAVVGPSGSGKSTLIGCLAGLDEPDGGSVYVAGARITRRPEAQRAGLRARWIGVLQQSGNLLDHLSVANNIRAAQTLVRSADRTEASVPSLLADVGLAGRARARPATLSGGETARAGLAVALANDPPLLLADEPTGEIDEFNEQLILDLFRRRAESGRAVVIVTHSTRAAMEADRIVHLDDGRIVDA